MKRNIHELEQVDLFELIRGVWERRVQVVVITLIFAVISVIVALGLPNKYTAEAIVMPTQEKNDSLLGGMSGQLGGLASLAGLNLNAQIIEQSQVALEILQSHKFVTDFIERHDLLPELMAVESWDKSTNTIKFNLEIYNPSTQQWVQSITPPETAKPNSQEAHRVFLEKLQIDTQPNGFIKIGFEHLSPNISERWVTLIIEDINAQMRENDIVESTKAIEFLENQLQKTTLSDARIVIYSLIEEHTKKLMFTDVRPEYAFKTIDPAIAPDRATSPNRALVCIAITFLGGVIAILIAIMRFLIRRRKSI